MAKRWMAKAFGEHPGALHRALHVPEGEKIPAGKLSKASHSKSGLMRKRVALARIGAKYGRGGGSEEAGEPREGHSSEEAAEALEGYSRKKKR